MSDQDAAKWAEAAAKQVEEAAKGATQKPAERDAFILPGDAAPNAASGGPGQSAGRYEDEE